MVLAFRGTAHPPPGMSDPDVANLSAAELSLTDLGRRGGVPLLFEHNNRDRIGRCEASWEGPNGELRVAGVISDARVEAAIRQGKNHGLSLGTDVVQDTGGRALYKEQQELSICNEPRRPGCYIDTVDGQSVRTRRRHSASGAAPLPLSAPSHYSPMISHHTSTPDRAPGVTMTDAASTPLESGETFTKDYVENLKAKIAEQSEETAKLRAFKSTHDQKQRDVISKLQPEITSYVDALVKENPDFSAEMKGIVDWSRNCHESSSLETAMPLARVISCASAQYKRTREEASVLSERAGSYGETCKELETTKADRDQKAQRIAELETLCNDRQTAMEKLQVELAKAGVIKDKFDFSKLSSREANVEGAAGEQGDVKKEDGIEQVTSVASRGFADELMSFVNGHTKMNGGTHRINQSGTGHAHLGATAGSMESEIAAAIGGF